MTVTKRTAVGAAALATSLALAACGSSSKSSSSSGTSAGKGTGAAGGTLTVNMGTAPDSLDPQFGYTTQALEGDFNVYTPLLTYAHKTGTAGAQIIPGLATAQPQISPDGTTYTMSLRPNLTYSNGAPVKASDFTYGIERAIKINWGGKSFFTDYIQGASDYDSGKAPTISGITTNDATGQIIIKLVKPYGAFANVLAFPAAAPVPTGTPMTAESSNPPPGVGAYTISKVVPNVSFTLTKNPSFASFHIPGIPTGYVDTVNVTIQSNNQTEAQQVLSNQVDVFDPGDTIPPSLLSQIQSQASSRFAKQAVAVTYYVFMNVTTPPFNNPAARQAVSLAFDRTAIERLSSGFLTPACYFLPPTIPGHVTAPCPTGDPSQSPSAANVAKAKQLVQQAGLAGTPVTVYSETRQPRQAYMDYYNGLLNEIGFKSTLKVIQDSVYFQTIGNQATHPQTGFADWSQDFPNPSDFYLLFDARSIQPQNNENFGNVNDPHIQAELTKLDAVPASQLSSVAGEWSALDQYLTNNNYQVTMGYEQVPRFTSSRVNFSTAVFHPLAYWDYSTFTVNK